MSRSLLHPLPVALWVLAVLGAAAVLVGPVTPWDLPVVVAGLTTCLAATTALALWLLRQ
jgi:hypothetical protein